MFILQIPYREQYVNPIKKYIEYISNTYAHYDLVTASLKIYPLETKEIINAIISVYKSIEFNKIFTLFNFLTLINYIITGIINKLKKIIEFDVLRFVECILFYLEYFIYKYYYRYNEFHFMYLCRYSPNYYSLCLKHFLKLEHKKNVATQYTFFFAFFFVSFLSLPISYAVIRDIEKYNTICNIYHYFISVSTPC